jgi:hypothetical protein
MSPPTGEGNVAHGKGTSFIEQLPYDILLQIFIFSHNPSFVFTSRTIFHLLGESHSDWLIMEVLRPVQGTAISERSKFKKRMAHSVCRRLLHSEASHLHSTIVGSEKWDCQRKSLLFPGGGVGYSCRKDGFDMKTNRCSYRF